MKECNKCKMERLCSELDRLGYTRLCTTHNPIPVTNADRFRAMTDKELAEALCLIYGGLGPVQSDYDSAWLAWLKKEVKDDDSTVLPEPQEVDK